MGIFFLTESERSRIKSLYKGLITEDSSVVDYTSNPNVISGIKSVFNKWANFSLLKGISIYRGQQEKKFKTYLLGEKYVKVDYSIKYNGGTLNSINSNTFNITANAKVYLTFESDLINLSDIDIPVIKANCNITCNYELVVGQNYELKVNPTQLVISTKAVYIPGTYWQFWISNNMVYVNFGKFMGVSLGTKNFGNINNFVELSNAMRTVNISGPKDTLDSLFSGKIDPYSFSGAAKLYELKSKISVK